MKVGYFEESEGIKSSTRLFSFFTLLMLFGLDVLLVTTPGFKVETYFIIFNLVILIAVFTPKYLHKIAELKMGSLGGKNGDKQV